MAPQRMLGLTLPCAQVAPGELRPSSGPAQACSGMLTLGSGQGGSCLRPNTKTESAKKKLSMTYVIISDDISSSSLPSRLVSIVALLRRYSPCAQVAQPR
jgi:hypothetical protein